jgi:hypothetical protein
VDCVGSTVPRVARQSSWAQTSDLIAKVQGLPIDSGYKNSLLSKLNTVKNDLQANNPAGACVALSDFKDVQSQLGKKLTSTQAADLISNATRIKTVIGC